MSIENSRGEISVAEFYNVLYTVNTQHYISKVILYVHSGHISATCFDCKRSSSGKMGTFLWYNKVSTQRDSILFTVKVKITYDDNLIYNKNIKINGNHINYYLQVTLLLRLLYGY